MFNIGALSSKGVAGFGSGDQKWNVENLRTIGGRAKCAASIIKDNNLNKIPERVFEAVPNVRRGQHESMPEFYARKYPHASLLFSDPAVQSAVLMAYVKNPEEPNSYVHLAMASVTPCMTPEQQNAVVEQMGFAWDDTVSGQPSRAFILRFMHNISEANQNFIAKKISDGCWGGGTLLEYVCVNANMFSSTYAKNYFVEAICSGKLQFASANAKKMLATAICDGHFGTDPVLLAKITDKLGDLFGASGVDATSIDMYLETLSILVQAVRHGHLSVDTKISQFQLAEIKSLFAQRVSPDMKKALADAICKGKFGDALEVRQILVESLQLFATDAADLANAGSFGQHLDVLHALAGFVFDQRFGKEREILKTLAENLKIFIVDLGLFSASNLLWFSDPRINEIRRSITLSIVSGKFKGMAPGQDAFSQLEKFKSEVEGYKWDVRAFTGLGLDRSALAASTAMDVDQRSDPLAGHKRSANGDAEHDDLKRYKLGVAVPADFALEIAGSVLPNLPVNDGRPRPPIGLLSGIQGGMQLRSANKKQNDSAQVGETVARKKVGIDLGEIQKRVRERAVRVEEKASRNATRVDEQPVTTGTVPQTPKGGGVMAELANSKLFLQARARSIRKHVEGTPRSNDSTPGKWDASPQNKG